jgi:hypothetical protein
MLAFASQEFAHALGREAERYERRTDIRHLAIFGYQAVTKLHDGDTSKPTLLIQGAQAHGAGEGG